jgi:hypothetical protein
MHVEATPIPASLHGEATLKQRSKWITLQSSHVESEAKVVLSWTKLAFVFSFFFSAILQCSMKGKDNLVKFGNK